MLTVEGTYTFSAAGCWSQTFAGRRALVQSGRLGSDGCLRLKRALETKNTSVSQQSDCFITKSIIITTLPG